MRRLLVPIDPGSHWLEAGITGLARQREWDAVATADAPGSPGDEAEFVALENGGLLVVDVPAEFDPAPLAGALEGAIEAPYRAVALRRPEQWAIGACSITVTELDDDPGGETVEIVRDAQGLSVRVDDRPSLRALGDLERLGADRFATFVVRARRLSGALFEIEVEPL